MCDPVRPPEPTPVPAADHVARPLRLARYSLYLPATACLIGFIYNKTAALRSGWSPELRGEITLLVLGVFTLLVLGGFVCGIRAMVAAGAAGREPPKGTWPRAILGMVANLLLLALLAWALGSMYR